MNYQQRDITRLVASSQLQLPDMQRCPDQRRALSFSSEFASSVHLAPSSKWLKKVQYCRMGMGNISI
eukprot:4906555-Amphidinium_carterae.1